MANQLTGEFQAVVQLSLKQIHGIMAMMHQNRVEKSPTFEGPTLPHSERFRVSGPPIYDPHLIHFGEWLAANRQILQSDNPEQALNELVASLPAGAAERVRGAFFEWSASTLSVAPGLRGTAEVQLGSPTVRLPDGAMREFTIRSTIRVRFLRDPGTLGLPEFIHGDVEVTYALERQGSRLVALPPSDDGKIVFKPLNGIGSSDVAAITEQLRKMVRENFLPSPVNLPAEFSYVGFKALGASGDRQAIALPLAPEGGEPQGRLNSIQAHLLKDKDFAFAVSREYFDTKFAPMIAQIKTLRQSIDVPLPVVPDATYILTVKNAWVEWKQGHVDLRISARAVTNHLVGEVGNFENIEVTQKMTVSLRYGTLTLSAADSDLSITGLDIPVLNFFGIDSPAYRPARNTFIAQRNQFLPQISQGLEKAFANHFAPPGALYRFCVVLRRFDGGLTGEYTELEVLPDGLILRGKINSSRRLKPATILTPTSDGRITAHQSWIPGGHIEKFNWALFRKVPLSSLPWHHVPLTLHWKGLYASLPQQKDNFMCPLEAGVSTQAVSICLTAYGKQFNPDGGVDSVDGFDSFGGDCIVAYDEPIYIAHDWDVFAIPKVHPDPPYNVNISDYIRGHLDMARLVRVRRDLATNHLVLFPRWEMDRPLDFVQAVLANVKRQFFSLKLVVVAPQGGLNLTRQQLELKLGLADAAFGEPGSFDRSAVHLDVTEDIQHGWSRTFGTEPGSGAFLMDATGKQAWGSTGQVEVKELASVLDDHMSDVPEIRSNFHQPGLQPGTRMPEMEFKDDWGNQIRLSDFHGQEVMLMFWQSWSQPCLRELKRLEALHKSAGEALVVIGICADPQPPSFEALRSEHNITFTLAYDAGRDLSRTAQICFWPTTLHISSGGAVHALHLGSVPDGRLPGPP